MFASYKDTPPPIVLAVLSEFCQVSQSPNDLEIKVLASLVPHLPCREGPGLDPYSFPKAMARYSKLESEVPHKFVH